jgi:hypothetical protein
MFQHMHQLDVPTNAMSSCVPFLKFDHRTHLQWMVLKAIRNKVCLHWLQPHVADIRACHRDDRPTEEGTPWGEQEELEQEMLQRAGAANAAITDHPDAPKQYDFVEDDYIDFVVMETIKGNLENESSR